MTESELIDKALADRAKLAQVIRPRTKVGPVMAVIMSVVFALLATPLVAMDLLLARAGVPAFVPGEPAPITVRIPQFSGFSDDRFRLSHGAVVVARGQVVDPATAELIKAVRAQAPEPLPAMGAYFALLLALALVYTAYLRRSHRGRLLRTQAVTLLLLLGGALVVKLALLLTAMSILVVPVATLALVATLVVDLSAGLVTGLAASVLFGLLVPFDLSVVAVLLVQSSVAAMMVGERNHKNAHILVAGLASGASAALAYAGFFYLSTGQSPGVELAVPLRSGLWAAAAGGVLSALVALFGQPLYQFLLGDITKSKLVEMEDLSHPLLKQIAENSPGTWQHSLAMANMAEIAANTIGANGRLVRVGAYYHDLGKSLQAKYFIENLEPGESSPHDRLPPEVSCDAIFAHVTEGVRLARKHRLPERIIDFMHMHHGNGLLEYFWAKCQENGNPKKLKAEDFRYPGVPPQSRETAILAICDAVEAASRTLKRPDERAIENLVQRIVYGKLHLGQLDQSGLSMSDLRKISNSLRETIKHAHHGRIEYPWQREEKQQEEAERQRVPEPVVTLPSTTTQRIITEPRLDSLDVPRPYWGDRPRGKGARQLETAPTEPLAADGSSPVAMAGVTTSQQLAAAQASHTGLSVQSTQPMAASTGPQPYPAMPGAQAAVGAPPAMIPPGAPMTGDTAEIAALSATQPVMPALGMAIVQETVATLPVASGQARQAVDIAVVQETHLDAGAALRIDTGAWLHGSAGAAAQPGARSEQPDAAASQASEAAGTSGGPVAEPVARKRKEPAEVLRELVEGARRDEAYSRADAPPGSNGVPGSAAAQLAAPEAGTTEDGDKPLPVGATVFGPPPATRPNGERTTRPPRSTTPTPTHGQLDRASEDSGPTVEPASPAASMLPPRARTSSGKQE